VVADPIAQIQWFNCDGTTGNATLTDPAPYVIPCVVENSIIVFGGAADITKGAYCGNTCGTTTTTTIAPL
jgi:hypothetical protein